MVNRCTLCWLGHCQDCDHPDCECGHEWAAPIPDHIAITHQPQPEEPPF